MSSLAQWCIEVKLLFFSMPKFYSLYIFMLDGLSSPKLQFPDFSMLVSSFAVITPVSIAWLYFIILVVFDFEPTLESTLDL